MTFDLKFEYTLLTDLKQVMELLTNPKLIRAWSGGKAVLEKKEGGTFTMFDGWVTGKVLKISENELAYTWYVPEWGADAAPSEVHYKLVKEKEGTKVMLEHKGLPSEEEMQEHLSGWTDHFFEPMEEYLLSINED
jgi:activator of HSP90 ATPase